MIIIKYIENKIFIYTLISIHIYFIKNENKLEYIKILFKMTINILIKYSHLILYIYLYIFYVKIFIYIYLYIYIIIYYSSCYSASIIGRIYPNQLLTGYYYYYFIHGLIIH